MGNQSGIDQKIVKLNMEISNQFNQILRCPNETEINNRLNILLNAQFSHAEWVGSIEPKDIREYYHDQCENVEKVLAFVIDFLYDTVKEKKELQKEHANLVNNCLRIVTILMPVIYENMEKATRFLWDYQGMNYQMQNVQVQHHNKLVVYISNDEEIDKKRESHISSGIKLIQALQGLCFYPTYTILPKSELVNISKESGLGKHIDNQLLWSNILQKTPHPNSCNKYDENRLIVLSSIISCTSSTLFIPCYGQNYLNPWFAYLTSPINRNNGLFFFNLLFQVLGYKPVLIDGHQARITKQITLLASQITYAILCHNPKPDSLNLILEVNVGLQQVNDYFQDEVEESQRGKLDITTVLQNGILNFLNQFNESQGIKGEVVNEIGERILFLLEEPLRSENSLFINSLKEIHFNEENFGILQQLLFFCRALHENITKSEQKMYRLFKVTIYQFCKSLDDQKPNNTFLVSLCLLMILSNNNNFALMLNKKKDFNINLKNFPIVDGTLADLLISCCAQAIINDKFSRTQYHPFNIMMILKNISPYIKNISRMSCQKLNQLSILFTDMDFLTQTNYSPFCIIKLIEMYNQILSKNLTDNYALVFEIFNRQELFSRISKINFNENTLRAYYRQLKERYESMKNHTTVPNTVPIPQQQHQQQNELQKQGQQLKDLNQQIELQKKESIKTDQPEHKKQKADQQDEMPSSSSLSSKKRPKRVTKKKVGLENKDGEKAGFSSKKDLDEHEKNHNSSKQEIEDEEIKEESKTEFQADLNQPGKKRGIEIEIHQKNPEDLYVERWKGFNWKQIYSTIPLSNISVLLKKVNEYVNSILKKGRYDLSYEEFIKSKTFLTNLKTAMVDTQFTLDTLQNYQDILGLSYQCCWAQIFFKAKFFPLFNSQKVLFFRSDIQPIQVNLNDQSINVELQSNNTLTDINMK